MQICLSSPPSLLDVLFPYLTSSSGIKSCPEDIVPDLQYFSMLLCVTELDFSNTMEAEAEIMKQLCFPSYTYEKTEATVRSLIPVQLL